jgi:hypothetical protein
MARILFALISAALLFVASANAQFQFFEQMFQGGQQQQQQRQQPQNVPSDSNWYQENYNNGAIPPLCPRFLEGRLS